RRNPNPNWIRISSSAPRRSSNSRSLSNKLYDSVWFILVLVIVAELSCISVLSVVV
ncbi:unnamed protein product, partial [Linum tenue]